MAIKEINFLKNKDFQTIQIELLFPYEERKENLAKLALLPAMLNYMNSVYDTEEKYQKEKKKRYILNCYSSRFSLRRAGFFCFRLSIPNEKVLNEDLLEEQIIFFQKLIYYPLIENEGFKSFELEREKTNLKRNIENNMKKIQGYYNYKLKKLIDNDDNRIFSTNLYDNMHLIDEVTEKNLYEFYKNLIYKNKPLVFVMGDVNKEKISNLIGKYLCSNVEDAKNLTKNYDNFLKPFSKIKRVEEKGNFKDSVFSMVYKVENMSHEDMIYLQGIRSLLASQSARLLDEKLRNEYDLVYSTRVSTYLHYGVLVITAFINKKNKDIVEEKIKEVMKELEDEKIIGPLEKNIKERFRMNLMRHLDDKFGLLDEFIYKKLGIDKTMEETYEDTLKITVNDILKFVKRLKLDLIYYLEEEKND